MLRWLRPPEAAALTAAERRKIRSAIQLEQLGQLRVALMIGAVIAAALPLFLNHAYPAAPSWIRITGPLLVAAVLLVFFALSWTARAQAHLELFEVVSGTLVVCGLALLATDTGGFESPLLSAMYLIWIVGAGVAPVSPRLFAAFSLLHMLIVAGTVTGFDHDIGSPVMFFTIAIGGYVLSVVGSYLREQAQVRVFLTNFRLDETQRSLAELNEQLENRVADQVVEILRRERQVATLSVQLSDQVKDRSHQLADAIKEVMRRRDDAPLHAGDVVGERARIVSPLGAGGMGRVYLADDLLTGQRVAVKLLRGHVAGDTEVLARFVAEAAAAAEVSHPGIIRTFHVDVDAQGHLYQVMEHVPGVTLAARAVRGPVAPGEAARIGAVIADALAAAHSAGVVHRDIKPANLILCATDPGVRILDFGLSKLVADDEPAHASGLTLPQRIVGTPRYMSPEQVQDPSSVGAPSDVYSLGLVLYELLAGRSPYTATTPAEYCIAHIQAAPAALDAGIPAPLASLVHACLTKDAADRPTAADLATELRTLADTLSAPPMPAMVRRELDAATQATAASLDASSSN